jgi:hypothetical protein
MMLPKNVLFALAAVFALAFIVIWFVFLRPVELRTAQGTITNKIFKPAGQYVQYPVGMRSAFFAPARIPIAECYVFTIRVEDLAADVGVSLNTLATEEFNVGQPVMIQYQERSLPGIWRRVYVLQMSR